MKTIYLKELLEFVNDDIYELYEEDGRIDVVSQGILLCYMVIEVDVPIVKPLEIGVDYE